MALSDSTVERFRKLFSGRDDVYGTFEADANGEEAYATKRAPVTLDLYRRHLTSGPTLGIHPLLDDGTTPWLCIDLDQPDISQAQRCMKLLQLKGVAAYLETSKRKGYHIWIFFRPHAPAHWARQFAKQVLRLTETPFDKVDIFPAQDRLIRKTENEQPVGNFVNLPYLGTAAAGRRVMLDERLTEWTLDEFLEQAEWNDPAVVLPLLVPHPIPPDDGKHRIITTAGGSAGPYRGPDPACIRGVLENPQYIGTGHGVGLRLAQYWLHFRKFDEEHTWALLRDWNSASVEPMDERALRDCLTGVTNDPSCTFLREEPAFNDACIWSRCSFYKPEPKALSELQADMGAAQALLEAHEDEESERLMVRRICEHVGFVGAWVEWMRKTTDAPALYHVLAALAAIAGAVGNSVRCWSFGDEWLFPNVWMAIIAPSGYYHKSTAIRPVSRQFGRYAGMPERLMPHNATTEALIQYLDENHSTIAVIDELSGYLQTAAKKYNSDLKMLLTSLYGGGPYHQSRKTGSVTLDDISLTVLAASTKENLEKELAQDDFATGFLVRMLFFPGYAKEAFVDLPRSTERTAVDKGEELGEALKRFKLIGGEISFDAVIPRLNRWVQEYERAHPAQQTSSQYQGLVSRAGAFAQKYAMLFQIGASVSDRDNESTWGSIQPWAMELAIEFVEWTITRQMSLLESEFAFSQAGRDMKRLTDFLKRNGGQATRTELARALSLKKREFDELVDTAVDAELIEHYKGESGSKGGRTPEVYKLVPLRKIRHSEAKKAEEAA